jgi:hypothetical protein
MAGIVANVISQADPDAHEREMLALCSKTFE